MNGLPCLCGKAEGGGEYACGVKAVFLISSACGVSGSGKILMGTENSGSGRFYENRGEVSDCGKNKSGSKKAVGKTNGRRQSPII